MNDKDKQAFDDYVSYLSDYYFGNDDGKIHDIKVWKAAVEYKQKEIDAIDCYIERDEKVRKLQTENKQLLTENGILSGEILTYKKMSDDTLKKLSKAVDALYEAESDFEKQGLHKQCYKVREALKKIGG